MSRATGRPFLLGRSTDVINEVSEPAAPNELASTMKGKSYLTHLLRNSPPKIESGIRGDVSPSHEETNMPPALNEQSPLLPKTYPEADQRRGYDTIPQDDGDAESQHDPRPAPRIGIKNAINWPKEKGLNAVKNAIHSKTLDRKDVWEKGVVQTASYLPAVFLGLLLNILDGLSYGKSGLPTLCRRDLELMVMQG